MIRRLLIAAMVLSLSLAGFACRSPAGFEPSEKDMLTEKEKYHLFDYARGFIFSSKKLDLSEVEKEKIRKEDPQIRIHYTGPKEGRMSMSWLIPGKVQILVAAEGRLDIGNGNEASWRVKVVNYTSRGSKTLEELGIPEGDAGE